MIDPRLQWAQMIDVTNACPRQCSNCTRMLAHASDRFYMTVVEFENACRALKNFPLVSSNPHAMIGMIGGEPLLHPQFEELVRVMMAVIPNQKHRGLWTGLDISHSKYADLIVEGFGYVNNNRHEAECLHSPVLIAIKDVIADKDRRERIIADCWLQARWSGSITPKGYFYCEVAAAFDMIFDGPGGMPVVESCWRAAIDDFDELIKRWCPQCGISLNLEGRRDIDEIDDMSVSNLLKLKDSPRVRAGDTVLADGSLKAIMAPWRYLQ